MDEKMEKLNFVINDGDSFYANEISITFGPAQFSFDFKNISPRVDMRSQDGARTFALKHNVVMIEPFQVKNLMKLLEESVAKFEKEYGTINLPESIKIAEKKLQSNSKKQIVDSSDTPSYFG